MPISGFSITLAEDDAAAQASLDVMARDGRLEIGPRGGRRVAVVGETPTTYEDRALWMWLNELPGVAHVDVVFVEFNEHSNATGETAGAMSKERGER